MMLTMTVSVAEKIPQYKVEAFKFGKGVLEYDFVLTGPVDDIISLQNMAPSVTVEQPELTSFARVSPSQELLGMGKHHHMQVM